MPVCCHPPSLQDSLVMVNYKQLHKWTTAPQRARVTVGHRRKLLTVLSQEIVRRTLLIFYNTLFKRNASLFLELRVVFLLLNQCEPYDSLFAAEKFRAEIVAPQEQTPIITAHVAYADHGHLDLHRSYPQLGLGTFISCFGFFVVEFVCFLISLCCVYFGDTEILSGKRKAINKYTRMF